MRFVNGWIFAPLFILQARGLASPICKGMFAEH